MNVELNDFKIRNANEDDCVLLAEWWNNGDVMAHAGFPHGLDTTADKIKAKISLDSDTTKRRLILEFQKKPIGEMSYYFRKNDIVEIGIKICESQYQNRGLGRIFLSMLIQKLFDMGVKKIILDTNLKNTRAQHVYESLGFVKTATHIDSWKDQVGELQSVVDYELTCHNFISFI